jgi:hypothetical protein
MGGTCQIPQPIKELIDSLLKKDLLLVVVDEKNNGPVAKTSVEMAGTARGVFEKVVLLIYHDQGLPASDLRDLLRIGRLRILGF